LLEKYVDSNPRYKLISEDSTIKIKIIWITKWYRLEENVYNIKNSDK
jgi:hypothetical protein